LSPFLNCDRAEKQASSNKQASRDLLKYIKMSWFSNKYNRSGKPGNKLFFFPGCYWFVFFSFTFKSLGGKGNSLYF